MKRLLSSLLVAGAVLCGAVHASAAVKVVATTEDLASLAKEVGGDKVSVEALARGYQDPHFVEAKPSFILKLNSAQLLLAVGRELEIGWLPPLVTQSRNAAIQPGGRGYLDASLNVRILDIPTGQLTRAMGDVHPQGNPHYWLDPANGRVIAQAIRDKFSALAPADKATFDARFADFSTRLAAAEKRWDAAMAPLKGRKLVTYHNSWPNFMQRFGLTVMGYVEPKPGIPPPPQHIISLIGEMKAQGVKVIVVEPYFDKKTPQSIATQVGGAVIELAPSVGAEKAITDYIKLFDFNIDRIAAALK